MEWKHRTKEQQDPLGSVQEDAETGKKEEKLTKKKRIKRDKIWKKPHVTRIK